MVAEAEQAAYIVVRSKRQSMGFYCMRRSLDTIGMKLKVHLNGEPASL